MAELPEGAELIPNPYNRVPGFSINRHYWVLEQHYPSLGRQQQKSVWVEAVTETVLMELMEDLTARFPEHKLFSLPRLGEVRRVELGYRGGDEIERPFAALLEGLKQRGFRFEVCPE